ncbi:MAG TPA: hypothetical protein VJZ00_20370, partial [Thermoanaerobaculia bacterium]|nr:hypothetical protein [Thermoanaerobaculia bacterium]
MAALVASMESGTPMTAEQREHIRTCERCRTLLDSAKEFQTLLAGNGIELPPIDPTLSAAEEVVRTTRLRRVVGIVVGVAIVMAVATALLMVPLDAQLGRMEALFILGAGIAIATFVAIPVLVLLAIVRNANRGPRPRLYKRLKSGRALSGVCLGIAESS